MCELWILWQWNLSFRIYSIPHSLGNWFYLYIPYNYDKLKYPLYFRQFYLCVETIT